MCYNWALFNPRYGGIGRVMVVTQEKRRFTRVSFREPVQFKAPKDAEFSGSLAYDISEEGLRFQTDNFIPLNESLILELQLSTQNSLSLHGKVMWVQMVPHSDRYQIGVKFDDSKELYSAKQGIQQFVTVRQPIY